MFSQTESLPNAGNSSQEHWLSTGTPEQPFVASRKERFVPRERLPVSPLGLSGGSPGKEGEWVFSLWVCRGGDHHFLEEMLLKK